MTEEKINSLENEMEAADEEAVTDTGLIAVLPLRDIVVFPHMIVPLYVGREKSVRALEEVTQKHSKILLLSQKDPTLEDPKVDDLYHFGTVASFLQILKLPDGTVKLLVEGLQRAHVKSLNDSNVFFEADIEIIDELSDEHHDDKEIDALKRTLLAQFEQYVKLNKSIPPEVLAAVNQINESSKLADTITSHLNLKLADKQAILETVDLKDRLEKLLEHLEAEVGVLQVEKKIRNRVKKQMEKTQREYYLNEQMKAIQKELGEGEDGKDELLELEEKIKKTRLTKEARDKALSDLKKLRSMSPMSAEATVVRNYLDWIVGIPWKKRSKVSKDLKAAEKTLDQDHYGLEKVKERILEYLAVQIRSSKLKGPILCLVGPPGVGKTSLARSIAKATGREYVRMSLGGVRDEAEIRGHRRTYIGAMPGKIIQGMKKAGTSNPLFLLDEIDKMGSDWRGDPASALLEVLDPEQNSTFADHYLEVDYDLSDVMFITTANSYNMPQPLLDRMEIIRVAGYTEDEKVEIAKRHLLKKEAEAHSLKQKEWSVSDDVIRELIRTYTREAGVRNLEREIAKIARKIVKKIVSGECENINVTLDNLEEYVGVKKFRYGESESDDLVGIVTGLAWTEVGGDILHIESVLVPGKGQIKNTGKLGDVMQESIFAALSYVKSRSLYFGIKPTLFDKKNIHVHVPEGATPKDGPSAGVAMATSLVSVMTGIPIRHDVAMTGEITLRGRVLPIGGLKEKLLAALRSGIKTVFIPKDNEKDLADIPEVVLNNIRIVPVTNVDDVINQALIRPCESIEWDEVAEAISVKEIASEQVLAH